MNIQQVSLNQYLTFDELQKQEFYSNILRESKKSKNTTNYKTALKISPQAKVPEYGFHQEHGHLTFIAPLRRTDKKIAALFYLCLCDCGEWVILEPYAFKKEERVQCPKCSVKNGQFIKDISGQIFGQLKALYPSNKRGKDGSVYWVCECVDCGYQQLVISYNLTKNKAGHLCGVCGAKSAGEYLIGKKLQELNIQFEKEKTFIDCKFPDTQQFAKFDFFVNNEYIIEIDGEHHYKPCRYASSVTQEQAYLNFIKIQQQDCYKNEYCFKNNIPILRIPYFYLKDFKITEDDLDPKKSKFRIEKL